MNTTSNSMMRKTLAIAVTVLGLGTAALAAHADDGRRGGHDCAAMHEGGTGKFAERMAKYHARLHDKLKLSAAQEPAWSTFTAAAMPKMTGTRPDRAAMEKMTAPERMEKWMALSKERAAAQESRLAALKTFYAQLTPEQKKIFDDSVPGGEHGGSMMRGMHR